MRRKYVFGWGMILCFCVKGWAQQPYLGTKTPYVPPHVSYTPPPAGYQPMFINYVGRHGARFLTKAGADQQVLEILVAAEKSNALTGMGKKVRVMAQRLQAAGRGNYENITVLGKEEQEAIGERMRYHYGSVFAGRGVEVVTTWKVRTQQSAEAFLKGLSNYTGVKNMNGLLILRIPAYVFMIFHRLIKSIKRAVCCEDVWTAWMRTAGPWQRPGVYAPGCLARVLYRLGEILLLPTICTTCMPLPGRWVES